MPRHPYATNSDERKTIPFFLALLAVFTTFGLISFSHWIHWEPPSSVDAPGTMAIYGIYYWLFKKFCWKWRWLRTVGIVSTPILEGTWAGTVQTSYAEGAPMHSVEAVIGQDWTDILIRMRTQNSHSRSTSASMTVSEDETILIYEYISEPNPGALGSLQIHFGTARTIIADENDMEGDYYTGRGRQNIGSLSLRRKAVPEEKLSI